MTDDILFLFLLLPVFSYTFLGKISIWMSHKTAEDFRRADVREREREREQNRTEQNKTEQKERERESFLKRKSAHLNCCRAAKRV
jgi:UPF0716 family protein affecting phage T7 exclusion